MSFLSDLFKGDFSNLGTDIVDAPESLAKHPSELYETLGGAAALATGGLALGGLAGLGAAGAGAADAGIATGGLAAGVPQLGADFGGAFAGDAALPSLAAPTAGDTSFLAGTDAASFAPTSYAGGSFPDLAAQSASLSDPLGGGTGTIIDSSTAYGPSWGASGAANAATGATVDPVTGVAVPSGTADTFTGGNAAMGLDATAPSNAPQGSSVWGSLVKGLQNAPSAALNSVTGNPLGIAAAGAGLGYDIYENKKAQNTPAIQNLNAIASQQGSQGQQLESYLSSGTLPPGLQQGVTNATQAAKAAIISRYASQGLDTNPSQNSALAQELAAVDTQATAMTAQVAQQLLSSGVSETGLSSQIYQTLAGIDQTQTAQIGSAVASMAAALSGKTQIKIGGSSTGTGGTTLTVP